MGATVFPAPVSSSLNAIAITAANPQTLYGGAVSLAPAIYTITCTTTTVASVDFVSGSTILTTAQTVSGSVSVNIASDVDKIRVWTDTGTNIVVTINKTAAAVSNNITGTLDVITASGTYTGTSPSGYASVLILGAGGGGGGKNGGWQYGGGGGGGAGGQIYAIVQLTGSMPVTIGAAGAGGARSTNGGNGGSTTFAGYTATGGFGGVGSNTNIGALPGGAGGTPDGAPGQSGDGGSPSGAFGPGGRNISKASYMNGSYYIGTISQYGNAPSTLGAGGTGQGDGNNPGSGAAGGPGVVYVLKY